MRTVCFRWLALLMCLFSAGCAHWNAQQGARLVDISSRITGIDWMEEAATVLNMSPVDQMSALDDRRQAFRNVDGATSRMRLVLMRALGTEGVRNEAAALALIEGFDFATLEGDVLVLAMILREPLQEHARVVSLLAAERKLQGDKDQRIVELEQQLGAFTSIEQSIKERQKAHQGVTP